MAGTAHFKEEEFSCPDCNTVILDPRFLTTIEMVRTLYGRPIIIESGYRCPKHNADVGGVPDSAHLLGKAADIRCYFAADRFELVKILLSMGIKRVGIGKNFLHFDISETLPQNVIWLYGEA